MRPDTPTSCTCHQLLDSWQHEVAAEDTRRGAGSASAGVNSSAATWNCCHIPALATTSLPTTAAHPRVPPPTSTETSPRNSTRHRWSRKTASVCAATLTCACGATSDPPCGRQLPARTSSHQKRGTRPAGDWTCRSRPAAPDALASIQPRTSTDVSYRNQKQRTGGRHTGSQPPTFEEHRTA